MFRWLGYFVNSYSLRPIKPGKNIVGHQNADDSGIRFVKELFQRRVLIEIGLYQVIPYLAGQLSGDADNRDRQCPGKI